MSIGEGHPLRRRFTLRDGPISTAPSAWRGSANNCVDPWPAQTTGLSRCTKQDFLVRKANLCCRTVRDAA